MANSATLKGMGSSSLKAARSRNLGPLTNKVTEQFQRLWRDAARVFVITTAETMAANIKTNLAEATGMSVASLWPLGAELRVKNIIVGTFSGFGPKYHGYNYEGPNSKGGADLGASHEGAEGHKSMRRGEIMGRKGKAFDITYGSKNRLLMTFRFQAVVYQHILWDKRGWNSVKTGHEAMLRFLDNNYNKRPYEVSQLVIRWFTKGSV